jgi:hypothetical protein
LAAQFARENRRGVASSVVTGLRLVNFITIPSACALIVLAHPMVQALFERGTFQATATDLTASLLPYAAIGLIALAANVVLTRYCFACHETMWPVTISVATVVLNVLLSLVWLPSLGARGLLLANSVSQSLQAILLLMLTARLVSGIDWGRVADFMGNSHKHLALALRWIGALGIAPEARWRRCEVSFSRIRNPARVRCFRTRAQRRRDRSCLRDHGESSAASSAPGIVAPIASVTGTLTDRYPGPIQGDHCRTGPSTPTPQDSPFLRASFRGHALDSHARITRPVQSQPTCARQSR